MITPYYVNEAVTVHHGDCLDVLPTLPAESVDAVVTDPPYGLGFMGRAWDSTEIIYGLDLWWDAFRVLKPGGHLLAFGGTRTVHRLTCAMEDAGFEIRDGIDWLYASSVPKSLDVSKAIDKAKRRDYVLAAIDLGMSIPGNNLHDWTKGEHSPGDRWWEEFKGHLSAEDWQRLERAVIGTRPAPGGQWTAEGRRRGGVGGYDIDVTAAATDDARRWSGWGTALKPAREPIVVARKPLAGTVAGTVLAHGTGAMNIDATRTSDGRWPANVVLSHAPDCGRETCEPGCPVAELDEPARFFPAFRYEPKAPTAERPRTADGTAHPTVKPLDLMRWLVRLVTPPGGVVLEPFAGSGTTAEACVLEGFRCIAIEREAAYLPLITARLAKPLQPALDFGAVA